MTKRKFSVSLAIAMALVLIMATAAVAGVSGGYVGWDGVIHYYEDKDATVEPVDESAFEARRAADETYRKYLQTIPRGECWIVTKDGKELTGTNYPDNIWDEEAFLALIEGTELPVPSLPGGYQLLAVSVRTEPEDTPYEEITLDDGAVLSKYKLKEPVAGEIDNYDYQFWKDGGNTHAISAEIVPASDHLTDGEVMHVEDYHTAEAVEVDGFEYGLYVYDNEFGLATCKLMKNMGDKMLCVYISAFEDLPKEAVLNLFNPEGNIDLSNASPSLDFHDSGVDFSQVPEGEYWLATWTRNEDFRESRSNDTKVADFAELARLTANKKLPVPAVPDGWSVEDIYAMAPAEAEPFEEVEAENDYILRKYRLKEVAESDLEHYRFVLNTPDGSLIFGEVFPNSEMALMEDWIYLPDFTAAEALSHPAFDEILANPASHANDNTEYLFTAGDARIYMRTDANVPAETVLSLFPVE